MKTIVEQQTLVERLRELAHDAPMAKIFQNHRGHKFIGEHTSAWSNASREWAREKAVLEAMLAAAPSHAEEVKP